MNNSLVSDYPGATAREVYTVARLNREVGSLLSSSFPLLWVEGELSNLARPRSGHFYFTLKDNQAQVRCAMFRNRNINLNFVPEDGMQVLVRARISLYEAKGEFQLTVEHMEDAGSGALQRAFEALKRKLAAEGLFDAELKQALPAFPSHLGVITSPTGAAIRDILSVSRRRHPALPIVIYPAPVQGEGAARGIATALREADHRQECDVLILARGGGSLEDLWAFNEETVARAIADCRIPVVSAVGHETDFTIADFAADVRAPTPSAAAELVSPDQSELIATLDQAEQSLRRIIHRQTERLQQQRDWLHVRLRQQHPRHRIHQKAQRLDDIEQRLRLALRLQFKSSQAAVKDLHARLQHNAPSVRLARTEGLNNQLRRRLLAAWRLRLDRHIRRFQSLARALQTVSPLATLERGYAIVTRAQDLLTVHSRKDVQKGSAVRIRLAHDQLAAEITSLDSAPPIQDNTQVVCAKAKKDAE